MAVRAVGYVEGGAMSGQLQLWLIVGVSVALCLVSIFWRKK